MRWGRQHDRGERGKSRAEAGTMGRVSLRRRGVAERCGRLQLMHTGETKKRRRPLDFHGSVAPCGSVPSASSVLDTEVTIALACTRRRPGLTGGAGGAEHDCHFVLAAIFAQRYRTRVDLDTIEVGRRDPP